ncbi:MAG: metal-dependent transcriptional regulator [Clostridiales bacterium]|jgi:Mn-dependent DtxR family transcriptional regulator|nr:metal-dependent transcriptional regulator [Clostridiales bacterium]
MAIRQSGEDYLETIYILSEKSGGVHAVDVANKLNFSKPSITRAMKILKNGGYITVDADNHIKLTESGRAKASGIFERHEVISDFLMKNGVERETALKDACLMEHGISDETFAVFKRLTGRK